MEEYILDPVWFKSIFYKNNFKLLDTFSFSDVVYIEPYYKLLSTSYSKILYDSNRKSTSDFYNNLYNVNMQENTSLFRLLKLFRFYYFEYKNFLNLRNKG